MSKNREEANAPLNLADFSDHEHEGTRQSNLPKPWPHFEQSETQSHKFKCKYCPAIYSATNVHNDAGLSIFSFLNFSIKKIIV